MPPRRGFVPEDLWLLRMVSDPQVSPEGQWVAYVVTSNDRAADEARLLALAVERPQRARQPALVDEAPVGEAPVANGGKAAHSKCPGTSAPFSTWAGT